MGVHETTARRAICKYEQTRSSVLKIGRHQDCSEVIIVDPFFCGNDSQLLARFPLIFSREAVEDTPNLHVVAVILMYDIAPPQTAAILQNFLDATCNVTFEWPAGSYNLKPTDQLRRKF